MAINPIKTPTEMLYEEANIPHFAGGGSSLAAGAAQLVQKAIKQYKQAYGRLPSPQEIAQLEQEVSKLSKPTSTMQGANVARMQKQEPYANKLVDEMGRVYEPGSGAQFGVPNPNKLPTLGERNYNVSQPRWIPNEQGGGSFVRDDQLRTAFDPRDEFLTHSMTGRTNAGTSQVPFTTNIDELQGHGRTSVGSPNQPLEALDQGPGPMSRSTEPSYDPHAYSPEELDQPVSSMTLNNNVTPGASAIAQMADIAQAGGARHDYTGLGKSVMGLRPQFPAGTLTKAQQAELERWRQLARDSGISETAIMAPTSRLKGNRFNSLVEEMEMGAPGPEASMGGYAHGGSVEDMRHLMVAYGHEPQHFRTGGHSLLPEASPYFQNIMENASAHNFNQVMDQANPEPTFQAQPTTLTSMARDKVASIIGDKPADRFFGTGSEGQKAEYMPLQFINPISAATQTVDAVPETARQLHEGNVLGAGLTAGFAGLGALPFAKPIKNIVKKFRHN